MTLTEEFIEEIKSKLSSPELAYEDYAYVLDELHKLGIKEARAYCYCQECDKEFEAVVNTDTFDWCCVDCGRHDNQ